MAVSNVATTSTTALAEKSNSEKSRATLGGDFETFLKLLTTQLKNQSPTDPMDTNQFTSQLVQFATVEQAIQQNSNLEKLIEIQKGTSVNNAAQYMGRLVQAEGNSGYLTKKVAPFSYSLPQEAKTAEITITDEKGTVVFTGPAPKSAGMNDVLWDGKNSVTGKDMPEGIYKIAINAKDNNGAVIKATTYTTGFVTSVNIKDGAAKLNIGKIELDVGKVTAIRNPNDFIAEQPKA